MNQAERQTLSMREFRLGPLWSAVKPKTDPRDRWPRDSWIITIGGVRWFLCSDLAFWCRTDGVGLLMPAERRCPDCNVPVHPRQGPFLRCPVCLAKWREEQIAEENARRAHRL